VAASRMSGNIPGGNGCWVIPYRFLKKLAAPHATLRDPGRITAARKAQEDFGDIIAVTLIILAARRAQTDHRDVTAVPLVPEGMYPSLRWYRSSSVACKSTSSAPSRKGQRSNHNEL
jgi:hypothetical protein